MTTTPGEKRPDTVGGSERRDRRVSSLLHPIDFVLSVIILAVCGALYYATTTFDKVSPLFAQDLPPEFFPRLLIWTIVFLAILLPFEHLFGEGRRERLDEDRRARIKPMAFVTAGLLLAIVYAIPWLGTTLSLVIVCLLVPLLWGERRMKLLIPFVVVFPLLVRFLFSDILKVHFEPGIWGAIFS